MSSHYLIIDRSGNTGDNQRFEAAVEEAIRQGFITEQLAMPEPPGEEVEE